MHLNIDIWHEIVSYCRSDDDAETLRSLALASRSLSKVALAAYWQRQESLMPIVVVINSFANDGALLVYQEHDQKEVTGWPKSYWVLRKPLSDIMRLRATEYLSYIRRLTADLKVDNLEELSLWSLLSTCLNCGGPLLPALTRLKIIWEEPLGHLLDYLAPLFSPSVKRVKLSCRPWPACKLVPTLINLMGSRMRRVEEFVYEGTAAPDIFSSIGIFSDLKVIRITRSSVDFEAPWIPPNREEISSISIFDFLLSVPSLSEFMGDIDVFPNYTRNSTPTPIIHHGALRNLSIEGTFDQVTSNLSRIRFSSLSALHVVFTPSVVSSWRDLHAAIASSCPALQRLEFAPQAFVRIPQEFSHLCLTDFEPLLSLPLRSFVSNVVTHQYLTPSDLLLVVNSWPNLQVFELPTWGKPLMDGREVLSLLSRHPNLCLLNMQLDLGSLLSPTALQDYRLGMRPEASQSQLERLHLWDPVNCPIHIYLGYGVFQECREARALVGNLLRLFPKLVELMVPYDQEHYVEMLRDLRNQMERGIDVSGP